MEFQNASCQTDISSERRAAQAAGVEEATQTAAPLRTAAAGTRVDAHTQVPRASWYADLSGCKVMEASGEHETAEQFMVRRHAAAATVQRWWRGWRGRQRAAALQAELASAAGVASREQANARTAAAAAAEHEVRRRMQPRRPSDFQLLYAELGAWWGAETAAIKGNEALAPEEQQAALQMLLAKETRLLQTIDKLKIKAAAPNRTERVARLLARLAAPKRWPAQGGGVMEVITPEVARAAQLAAAYSALATPWQGMEPRLAALLAVKQLAKEANCSLAREVVSLVDREADLLHRGRSPDLMVGLRQRTANCFLALIKMPEFNPAACALQVELQSSGYVPAWPPALGAATGTAELVVRAATVAAAAEVAGAQLSAAESSRTV